MRRKLAVLFAAAALIVPGGAAFADPGENNARPQNPPCDADHGHPEENSAQCDDDQERRGKGHGNAGNGNAGNGGEKGNAGKGKGGKGNGGKGNGGKGNAGNGGGGNGGNGGEKGQACPDQSPSPGTTPPPGCGQGDRDSDGVPDNRDNCPDVANPDQKDADRDGVGDACDTTPAPSNGNTCTDGVDNDGDGATDGKDTNDCQNGDTTENTPVTSGGTAPPADRCSAENADTNGVGGDTIAQQVFESPLGAAPVFKDPDATGPVSRPVESLGDGTPLDPVTNEVGCAASLTVAPL